jgi:hypothetical protein
MQTRTKALRAALRFASTALVLGTAAAASAGPNLVPQAPSGWSAPLVVSSGPGTHSDSTLRPGNPLYLDWAFANTGDAAVTSPFLTELQIDGITRDRWTTSSVAAGETVTTDDYELGVLAEGNHTLTFRVDFGGEIAETNESDNVFTKTITIAYSTATCTANATTLCLGNGRYTITGTWENQFDGSTGPVRPIRGSELAGYLYFTDPANIELMIKILDFASYIKVFYGELTNLHFTLNVTDNRNGLTKIYRNGPNDCGAIDHEAFPSGPEAEAPGAALAMARSIASRPPIHLSEFAPAIGLSRGGDLEPTEEMLGAMRSAVSPGATCSANAETLCLLGGRYRLTLTWRNQYSGVSGKGKASPFSSLAGSFSFDDPNNIELLVKVLDFGDRILVLYGSLSNLEYRLSVTDLQTNKTKIYVNSPGTYCGGLDNDFNGGGPGGSGTFTEPPWQAPLPPYVPGEISVSPSHPSGGYPATLVVSVPGASSISVTPSGAGCGDFSSATGSGARLELTRGVGTFGPCRIVAVAAVSGQEKTYHTDFTVEPASLVLPAVDVPDGEFLPGSLPVPNGGPAIASIAGPGALINGGAVELRLTLANPGLAQSVRTVLASVPPVVGFEGYWAAAAEKDGNVVLARLHLDPDFHGSSSEERVRDLWSRIGSSFPINLALEDDKGRVGPVATKSFELLEVGTGSISIALAWDTPTDVDLHCQTPTGTDIYYGNLSDDGGQLDLDSNPACRIDGRNQEHIVFGSDAPAGTYIVRVDYWSDCNNQPANWTVTTTVCGDTQTFSGHFAPGSDDAGGSGSGIEVTRFVADCGCTATRPAAPAGAPVAEECETYEVLGQAVFEKRHVLGDGSLSTPMESLIRGARVRVRRSADGKVLAEGVTGLDGQFDLLYQPDPPDGSKDVYVEVATEFRTSVAGKLDMKVVRANGDAYTLRSVAISPRLTPVKAGLKLIAAAGDTAPAFNIWTRGVRAAGLYRLIYGEVPPSMEWRWTRGTASESTTCPAVCYNAADEHIFVGDSAGDLQAWSDSILLHHYGHFWARSRGLLIDPTGASGHTFDGASNRYLAWNEGLATFWAQHVLSDPVYLFGTVENGSTKVVGTDLETLASRFPVGTTTGTPEGDLSEFLVAAILWDIADPDSSEIAERTDGSTRYLDTVSNRRALFTALQDLPGKDRPTLRDLLDSWCRMHIGSVGDSTTGVQGIVSGINRYPYTFDPGCQ